ncbi:MAG: hypothetical protein HQK81_07120 [Desulfovibrionaceae bacterium]|nr:hypothetical protein [Desulfovibrionaceae bacterium]MBF0513822.1 hypothetical protein [Desulfovibrionaceae bacterium]
MSVERKKSPRPAKPAKPVRTGPVKPRGGERSGSEAARQANQAGQASRAGAGPAPQASAYPAAPESPGRRLIPVERLFPETGPPFPQLAEELQAYAGLLAAACPLKPKHRALLARAVRDLSRDLTRDRGSGLAPNYLSDKAKLAAYVRYFLPWNLLRLGRLLAALPLDPPEGAHILDAGAGPLTFVQALWLARPDLRGRALRFTCADSAPAGMRLGLALFSALAGQTPWEIRLVHASFPRCLEGPYDLIALVNVINEQMLGLERGGSRGGGRDDLAETLLASLAPAGRLLVVEPGTRMCGRRISGLRRALLEAGGRALAPCTHQDACPLGRPDAKGWCHFNLSVRGAPAWLAALSAEAGLPKKSLSLSFLLAAGPDAQASPGPSVAGTYRVVSEDFPLPGRAQASAGRYGCGPAGLALLVSRERGLVPGDAVRPAEGGSGAGPSKDPKTGAVQIEL